MARDESQSFSAGVKDELIRMPMGKSCCQLSEIGALTQTSGHLSFRGGGRYSYRTDRREYHFYELVLSQSYRS